MKPNFALVAALLFAGANASMALGGIVEDLRAKTPSQSIELRNKLISAIWGDEKPNIPIVTRDDAHNIDLVATFGRNPDDVAWLVSDMGHGMKAKTLYATFADSRCLFVINAAHSQGFVQPPPSDLKLPISYWSIPGSVQFLKRLAAKGCDLLLSSMPFYGENRYYALDVGLPMEPPGGNLHDDIPNVPGLKPDRGSLLQYYVDPVLGAVNFAIERKHYNRIGMAGLSGGGWTTTLVSAIDSRIQRSYSVAGSLPTRYKSEDEIGDWEQRARDLLDVADYSDLYLMGSAEKSRKTHLIYNSDDGCCFKGRVASTFANDLKSFAKENGFGVVDVTIVQGHDHDVAPAAADFILEDFFLDEESGGRLH
jgi:hypothetical protein